MDSREQQERQHIEELARQVGARLFFDLRTTESPYADIDTREVHLPAEWMPADGPMSTYWSALHELGHIVDQPGGMSFFEQMFGSPRITFHEARAWEWALQTSRFPLTEHDRSSIGWSLGGYLAKHGIPQDTSTVEAVIAQVGDPDWSLLEDFWKSIGYAGEDIPPTWRAFLNERGAA